MSFSELSIEIALNAFNLLTNSDIKESLKKLIQLEITKEDLKTHDLMNLAKKFMMADGVKEDARKLIAKLRRIEGVSSKSGSGSPADKENRKRSREVNPEEEMLSSKRTAPVKYAGKKRVLDIAPEQMTLAQLQEFVTAHPKLAGFVDHHFEKFVLRDYPSAAIYKKPSMSTWQEHYDRFAKLSKPKVSKEEEKKMMSEQPKQEEQQPEKQEENKENEKKQSEENEKFNKFMERKRATAVRKVPQKPVLIETAPINSAVSIRESYRQARIQEMTAPVAKPSKRSRKRV